MFRMARQFTRYLQHNSASHIKISRSNHSFFSSTHTAFSEPNSLIQLAEEFANEGKNITAENIYQKIIQHNPHCKIAYEKLWNSWLRKSLKVPEQELESFMISYSKYIQPENVSNSTSPLLR